MPLAKTIKVILSNVSPSYNFQSFCSKFYVVQWHIVLFPLSQSYPVFISWSSSFFLAIISSYFFPLALASHPHSPHDLNSSYLCLSYPQTNSYSSAFSCSTYFSSLSFSFSILSLYHFLFSSSPFHLMLLLLLLPLPFRFSPEFYRILTGSFTRLIERTTTLHTAVRKVALQWPLHKSLGGSASVFWPGTQM